MECALWIFVQPPASHARSTARLHVMTHERAIMPNLVKIVLFFLIAFSLCPIGVVLGIECYTTVEELDVKAEKKEGHIRWGSGYISWNEAQRGFWDAVSVDNVIGYKNIEVGRAKGDHCLVMIYEITPKEGSDYKYKIWKSWSGKDFCMGDERKQMEKWANEARGSNFRCWTCNDGPRCNERGTNLFCYDTIGVPADGSKPTVGTEPYAENWKQMQEGFKEVVSVDEELVSVDKKINYMKEYKKLKEGHDSCLVLAYQITPQKGSEKKFKLFKSSSRKDYCESTKRKQVEEWVKDAGGFNFKCWTCIAKEKDNCNVGGPKIGCWAWDTKINFDTVVSLMRDKLDYADFSFTEVSSAAQSLWNNKPSHENEKCSAYSGCLIMSFKKGSRYRYMKSCAPAVDYCESPKRKELEELVKEKEGGYNFKCSVCDHKDYCNDKMPTQKCWRTNDSINGGFVNASNIDATVAKANFLCQQETPHCVMQSCSKKNGSGVLIRQGCSAGDNEKLKGDDYSCGKDAEEKGQKHCGDAKDYKCGMCYEEDNCNVQRPVHCWQTSTKPPQANDDKSTMYIEAPDKFVVVGERKKCPLHLRTCTTEFCYLENSVLVRKSCAEPNYCKGSSPEYKQMKQECEGKRGEYECKQCHEKDNCNSNKRGRTNGENSTRQCWSTIRSDGVSIDQLVHLKDKFDFGAAENAPVGGPQKCSEEQSTCITEICRKNSDFLISKGCGPVDYCAEKDYPNALKDSRNYCNEQGGEYISCDACHDNDNCNVPWQGPPPAPKQPEPEPSAPSAAGTTGKWHHGMMVATWTLIVFMSSIVPLMLIKMNS